MSTEAVKEILGRAVVDETFRTQLLEETDEALEGYDLTEEEREAFEHLSAEVFEGDAEELEERLSRSVWIGGSILSSSSSYSASSSVGA